MSQKKFLIINGPNLNKLGEREPEVYGTLSLDDIKKETEKNLSAHNVELVWFQSNVEGEIVNEIQKACGDNYAALIINPAAYSHTSVAIHDALKLFKNPVVEVHLSNTNTRDDFRKTKVTAQASNAVIEGLGHKVYTLGVLSQLI